MSELIRKGAGELAKLIASGEVSSREVAEAHYARIDAVDGRVHAFLHLAKEHALKSADAVDAKRKAGEKLGPLAGVPLALLPIIALMSTVGMVTSALGKNSGYTLSNMSTSALAPA